MIVATGSQLDRIVRCQASAALPQVIDANEDDREDRDRGAVMHKFLERVGDVGRELALAEVDEKHRGFCADIELAKLTDKLSLSREIALAYNWRDDTARLLQPVAPRAYEVDETCEVPLTLDLVGVGRDAVYVGDYKSGHGWLPEPETSYQLGVGAIALARLYKKQKARVEYIRIRDDGTVRKFDHELDAFALMRGAAKISELLSGLPALRARINAGEVPNVTEGRWCRYCPAAQHCPAKTALIRNVLGDPQPVPYVLPLTPESAQRAYGLLKKAKEALSQIEGALYAYAKTSPIPVGVDEDGSHRFFGELRRPGNEELDGAIVHQVMTELYGGEVANKVVSMEATKKAISDAVRKVIPEGEKITHHTEKVYELVRERGGGRRKETCTTVEYTVDPDGAAKARRRKAS